MQMINLKKINGYIEGYYGAILNWEERRKIIDHLAKNKMNYYFYAPKEDIQHRLKWRENYKFQWVLEFKKFVNYGRRKNIEIIFGISPGLDFNFQELLLKENIVNHKCEDLITLIKKFNFFKESGVKYFSLLLDDIDPMKFNDDIYLSSEGYLHARLTNLIKKKIVNLFVVPRVYADELKPTNKNYLSDFTKHLQKEIPVFYCGKNIVSKEITESYYNKFKKKFGVDIIFWDNFYANDYCPRRLFIGPHKNRSNKVNIMYNLTGMIATDLLILNVIYISSKFGSGVKPWKDVLKKNNVPPQLYKIYDYVKEPFFNDKKNKNTKLDFNDLDQLEYLLWKWKSDLQREWYCFLFGLKQDFLINTILDEETIKKINKGQNSPLANKIISK